MPDAMPESILLMQRHAEEELAEFRRKFHPHHDYLTLIIPSTWFLFGVITADFYFYRAAHVESVLRSVSRLQPLVATASTSLEFFLALTLFITLFSVVYVIGQMINGLSALLLDRLIVKKLLKYPFGFYRARAATPDATDDRTLFRNTVQRSSYLIYCANLIPFVFLEASASVLAYRLPTRPWMRQHQVLVIVSALLLIIVHFGWPSARKARRQPIQNKKSLIHYDELFWCHIAVIGLLWVFLSLLLLGDGDVFFIMMLPAINVVIGVAERFIMKEWAYSAPYAEDLYCYARACFTNPIYLAAKLVGYGDPPSRSVIDAAQACADAGDSDNDLFWMTYITVQDRGGATTQTMYHFLASYSMVRNLCNATAFVVFASIVAFVVRWPITHAANMVAWTFGLCCLMYALFARYLYLYGTYFSKYVIRVAAYISRRRTYRAVAE